MRSGHAHPESPGREPRRTRSRPLAILGLGLLVVGVASWAVLLGSSRLEFPGDKVLFWLGMGCLPLGSVAGIASIGVRLGWRTGRAVFAAVALYAAIGTTVAIASDQVSLPEDDGLGAALRFVGGSVVYFPLLVLSAITGEPVFD